MRNHRRLSLRSRLLVLLIAVTAAFLLIMGGVTTLVLTRRLTGQFNADLVATAARNPQTLAGNTNGYLAAAFSRRTGQIILNALDPPHARTPPCDPVLVPVQGSQTVPFVPLRPGQ